MNNGIIDVYAVCRDCEKQILTYVASDGRRLLLLHRGRGQREPCPGGDSVATGLAAVHYCGYGCGVMIAADLPHCPACERWRSETQAKIDGGS